jgi:ABC-type bacteriocin/lantibiotic exporter with double-glycine peptidase domain
MSNKNQGDAEAVKYIAMFLVFLLILTTLFFVYAFINELFALVLGASLLVVVIFFIARRDTLTTVKTTLELSNENNKAMAEVEKYRQQAQIAQLKAFQEVLKSEGRVKEIEQRQTVKVLDKQPDFDRRLLTVREDLLLTDGSEDGDFRIVEG